MTPTERFLWWIKERHNIYLKRQRGEPKPWTEDKILQQYRFCNVRRIDDKVSQWLLKNWYEPYFDHPNMLLAVALGRFLNLPYSLDVIGFPVVWNKGRIKRMLRSRHKAGHTIYNAAYIVRGNNGQDKLETVLDFTIEPLRKSPPLLDTNSIRSCWEAMVCRYGFGSFMAGQIVADLRWAVSGKWSDRRRWAAIGPGSQRGLNRLLKQDIKTRIKQDKFETHLQTLIKTHSSCFPSLARKMEAIDWQNCLCEFDKYERVRLGEGRPKQRYQGA